MKLLRLGFATWIFATAAFAAFPQDIFNVANAVWAPDRAYLNECYKPAGDSYFVVIAIVGQTEYFDGLAKRFPGSALSIQGVKSNAKSLAWDKLKVESLRDLRHHSSLDRRTIWLGPLDLVACHFRVAEPFLSVAFKERLADFARRAKRVEPLYRKFLEASDAEKWVQFDLFATATLDAGEKGESLLHDSESNLFVGYRSKALKNILDFQRELISSNAMNF